MITPTFPSLRAKRSNPELDTGLPRRLCLLAMTWGIAMLCATSFASSPAHAQDITTGLVGHWKLDETSGTTAIDSGSGGNDCAMQNAFNATDDSGDGKVSTALEFLGTTDHWIDCGSPANLDNIMSGGATISAWIYPHDYGQGDLGRILDKTSATGGGDGWNLYLDDRNTAPFEEDKTITFRRAFSGSDYGYWSAPAGTIGLNQWTHIVLSYDDTSISNNPTLYVNGVQHPLIEKNTPAGTAATDAAQNLKIGSSVGGVRAFDGFLDDIRIYNRILSTQDIAMLYANVPGSMRYNSASEGIEYYNGRKWVHAGSGSYSPNAVTFNGTDTYIDATGTMTDSPQLTASLWLRKNVTGDYRLFEGSSSAFFIRNQNGRIRLVGENNTGTMIMSCDSSASYNNTDWHHVLFSIDLSTPGSARMYIDDSSDLAACTTYLNDTMDLDENFQLGRALAGTFFNGDIADFWMSSKTYIDFSVEANRRKFISANGMPMYLGANGSLPLGKTPDIFLSGDTDDWHTNKGTGGGFTENGTLTSANTHPGNSTANITLINNAGGANNAFSLDLRGDFAFRTNANNHQVQVWDISDVSNIAQLDSIGLSLDGLGTVDTVAGTEDAEYAYAIGSANFGVIDATDKNSLTFITSITGHFSGGGDIDIIGDTAYTAARTDDEFAIVDITNRTSPSVTGSVSSATQLNGARDLSIVGDYAFVASQDGDSITIIDISTPATPSITGFLSNATNLNSARTVQTTSDGNTAYVGLSAAPGGFSVIDTSDKAAPAFVARYSNTATTVRKIVIDETHNRLFLIGEPNTLEVWDISNPRNPVFMAARTDAGNFNNPWSLGYQGGVVFVGGNDSNRLNTLSVTNCSAPAGTKGDIFYNTDDKVMQYCNGVDWVAMGPVGGTGGGGCANPAGAAGDMVYNEDFNVMQFCNSEDWVGVGQGLTSPPTLAFHDSAANATDLTTYTFSTMDIGTASADRLIIVATRSFGGPTPSTVTVGGINATSYQSGMFWTALVPTGTTADVVVTHSATVQSSSVGIWSLKDYQSAVPMELSNIASSNNTPNLTSQNVTIDMPPNSVGIFKLRRNLATNSTVWTNATERYEYAITGGQGYSGADYTSPSSGDPGHNVSATFDSSIWTSLGGIAWR